MDHGLELTVRRYIALVSHNLTEEIAFDLSLVSLASLQLIPRSH